MSISQPDLNEKSPPVPISDNLSRPPSVESRLVPSQIDIHSHGAIVQANQKMYEFLQLSPRELEGKSFFDLLSPESRGLFTDPKSSLFSNTSVVAVLGFNHLHEMVFLKANITSDGEKIYLNGLDITQEIGQIDSLSGLYTRPTAINIIENKLAERGDSQHGIILCDIDNLKKVNDDSKRGHQTGDSIIRLSGILLRHFFREGDVLSRWGGDEFLILLKNITNESNLQSKIVSMDRIMTVLNGGDISALQGNEVAIMDSVLAEVGEYNNANPNNKISIPDFRAKFHMTAGYALISPSTSFDDAFRSADGMLYQNKHSK